MLHSVMLNITAELTLPLHKACLLLAPVSENAGLYTAMICGNRTSINESFKFALSQMALLHLLVVSGFHLAFLESLLRVLLPRSQSPIRRIFIWSVLILFALINQLRAPIARALIALVLRSTNRAFGLQWTRLQIITASGFATFAFCRTNSDRQALLLSWLATLALTGIENNERSRFQALFIHTRAYVLILPALLPLSAPSPFSILCNWILAPLLGIVLFPASLLGFLIQPLVPVTDCLWKIARLGLELLSSLTPNGASPIAISQLALWSYLALITFCFWFFHERQNGVQSIQSTC